MDIGATVPALLRKHPHVRAVRLVGSRASRELHDLSDWDFVVETADFDSVAEDLPELVAPLQPIGEQWDRYASHECYMLMLPGPTKIDVLFPDELRDWSPPWQVSPQTLEAIDCHFWDWILWLEQKRRGGNADLLARSLENMYDLMLRPMGAPSRPRSIPAAITDYLEARGALERELGLKVSRRLEQEVRPALLRGKLPAEPS